MQLLLHKHEPASKKFFATILLLATLVLGNAIPARAASWDSTSFDQTFTAAGVTTNSAAAEFKVTFPSSPSNINFINFQLRGFINPDITSDFNNPNYVETVNGDGTVTISKGTFSAIVKVSSLTLTAADVSALNYPNNGFWSIGISNPNLAASSREVSVTFASGSLVRNPSATRVDVGISGYYNGGMPIYDAIASFSSQGLAGNSSANNKPNPTKYEGPEFIGLSGKSVALNSKPKLTGKKLDQISSLKIGETAVSFSATADSLALNIPAGLAPGLYDLVIESASGKLTHLDAIRVREPLKAFSLTTKSKGRIAQDQLLEHFYISQLQDPDLNKVRCVVNSKSPNQALIDARRLCSLVRGGNSSITETVIEAKSTVKGDVSYARVVYGWTE